MNSTANKFLLARDSFIPSGLFTKIRERIPKFKETGYTRYIYKNELGKACFQHDIAYRDCKDLPKRMASNKVSYYVIWHFEFLI